MRTPRRVPAMVIGNGVILTVPRVFYSSTGLHTAPYLSDYPCVAAHPSHALAKRKKLPFEDTLEEAWIGVAPGRCLQDCRAGTGNRRSAARGGDALCTVVGAGAGPAH